MIAWNQLASTDGYTHDQLVSNRMEGGRERNKVTVIWKEEWTYLWNWTHSNNTSVNSDGNKEERTYMEAMRFLFPGT